MSAVGTGLLCLVTKNVLALVSRIFSRAGSALLQLGGENSSKKIQVYVNLVSR